VHVGGLLSRFLALGLWIQKFRSRRLNCERQVAIQRRRKFRLSRYGPRLVLRLFRIQSEQFELLAPFGGSITKPLDPDAAWQTTFNRRSDEVRCEES
jgi:hypothetical protein